jgi:DNA-binding beta-propeller fold protein YncE
MRALPRSCGVASLLALLTAFALGAPIAQANRALHTENAVNPEKTSIPEEEIEGACGVAISPGGEIYVSDYYHHAVEGFGSPFQFIPAGNPPEGPCQIAFDSAGALYANLWHQSVVRLRPSFRVFDQAESTGVAVDEAGNVYVNDRTYIAVYEPSGAQIGEIGLGSLKDAYGLAVFGGRVYVPDAGTNTVKVYEPANNPLNPVATITGVATPQHRFVSLVDASVAVDPTNGHVLVLDNLQPGFEHPEGAIDEFDSSGAFLSQLASRVIDAGPSGLALDGAGNLYASSGNSEEANVFAFGPYTEFGPEGFDESVTEEDPPGVAGEEASAVALGVSIPTAAEPRAHRHKGRRHKMKLRRHRRPRSRAPFDHR